MKRDTLDSKKTGRPRAYSEPEVLKKAMLVFWEHGYESTSVAELVHAMGMNAPSIYSAFGDKKELFLKALDLYVGNLEDLRAFVYECATAYEAAYEVLKASAIRFTGNQTPSGCMLASATASGSAASVDVQAVAAKKRAAIEKLLRDRIERDVADKLLSKKASPSALAALTIAMIQGMSVAARDGGTRKKLMSLVDSAMAAWPQG